jgi:hypothetical protein
MMVTRLLASSREDDIRNSACNLLLEVRCVLLDWLRELQKLRHASNKETPISQYQGLIFETAASCRLTYDVDQHFVSRVLATKADVAILLECAIAINENRPPPSAQASSDYDQLQTYLDRHLAHRLEARLRSLLQKDRSGLDIALAAVWPNYRASSASCCFRAGSQWLSVSTDPGHGGTHQTVEYDLIQGRLLVDGKPLGRLPREITTHITFIRTFGQVKCLIVCTHQRAELVTEDL